MVKQMESTYTKVENEIQNMPANHVFIIRDLDHCGSYEAVRKDLQRLESTQMVSRILNGIYYKPSISKLTGEIVPSNIYEVVKVIGKKNGWTILPSGLACINMLGLSTQVPANYSFISDGPNKNYVIDGFDVKLKHGNPKDIRNLSYKTGIIVQGIKQIGKDDMNDKLLFKIASQFTEDEVTNMVDECKGTTIWIYEYVKKMAEMKRNAKNM